ncbi:hypothetical protein AGABI2DRAFT_120078 [Agaricus bisporus var. bisporus H97]|uniref:hypothetical protein n=1 Tax=Agaricus bisporus var. bisporus (strain H97 / ATCC MYA-4626 / FGSC 10389) TaxID=936046 RepID=UPI00029F6750|nr:hypothetical protein AGABI2DRAFT_120078 [Agaricus bisporus var. bisporus H97]EKV45109.1 hypothetical protein AGABI2DRAFT_120078 [Agaricus bisporus var. bisporus H97]
MHVTSIVQLRSLWWPGARSFRPAHSPTYDLRNPGLFNGAKGFVLNDCSFYDVHVFEDVLSKLYDYALPKACFNSDSEDPLPRCHPDTRRYIIDKAREWFRSPDRKQNMLWISGAAGVGKSAVMGSIAKNGSEDKCLGASVFLSKSDGRDDPRRIIATIAVQLSTEIQAYRCYLIDLFTRDPQLLEKETEELFRKLISEPFGEMKLHRDAGPRLVLIDGLDECDKEEGARGDMCKILAMISQFVEQSPSPPFVWVIASRPESWLKTTLSKTTVKRNCWNKHIGIDTQESFRDMKIFLESEFAKIREDFPYHMPINQPWPSASQTRELVHAFSGLFVFASTAMRFVRDRSANNPLKQLDSLLSTIAKSGECDQQHNPLSALHKFYLAILKGIPTGECYRTAKRILGACDLLPRNTMHATSLLLTCNFLGIKQGDAYSALNWLHSVLAVPLPQEAVTRETKPLHSSFGDFLRDSSTPDEFRIKRPEVGEDIVKCSLRILKQANSSKAAPLPQASKIDLSWDHESAKTCEALLRTAYDGFRILTVEDSKFLKSFPLAKRAELLEEVDFSKLDCYVHPDVKTSVHAIRSRHQSLFEWLSIKLKTSPEFQKSRIVKSVPMSRINYHNIRSDRTAIHFKFTEEKGKTVVRPKVYSGVKEVREKYRGEDLESLKSILPSYEHAHVHLLGKDPKKSCIIFEHTPSSQANSDPKSIKEIFFIPYKYY